MYYEQNKKYYLYFIINIYYDITINVLAQPESTTSDFSLENVTGTTDPESYRVKNTASLTINNVSSSDTFYAYKIIDVFYNTSTNVVTYEFTLDFKTFLAQSDIYKSQQTGTSVKRFPAEYQVLQQAPSVTDG